MGPYAVNKIKFKGNVYAKIRKSISYNILDLVRLHGLIYQKQMSFSAILMWKNKTGRCLMGTLLDHYRTVYSCPIQFFFQVPKPFKLIHTLIYKVFPNYHTLWPKHYKSIFTHFCHSCMKWLNSKAIYIQKIRSWIGHEYTVLYSLFNFVACFRTLLFKIDYADMFGILLIRFRFKFRFIFLHHHKQYKRINDNLFVCKWLFFPSRGWDLKNIQVLSQDLNLGPPFY